MKFNNKGFTLIEMIVTIGILGILAVTAITALNPFAQFQKANDAKRKGDLSQIQKALESYYDDYKAYPDSKKSGNYYYLNPITTPPAGKTIKAWGSSWQPYMNVIPKDPSSGKYYVYYSPPTLPDGTVFNGQGYCLYASLDKNNDPGLCFSGGAKCTNAPAGACGSGVCNFGICSPNASP
jgi:type II secretion system protein G